jgi:hypothetical protein
MSRYEEWEAQNFHDEPDPGSTKWHNWAVNQILDKTQEIERLRTSLQAIVALHDMRSTVLAIATAALEAKL